MGKRKNKTFSTIRRKQDKTKIYTTEQKIYNNWFSSNLQIQVQECLRKCYIEKIKIAESKQIIQYNIHGIRH